jgi:hypothetical protein
MKSAEEKAKQQQLKNEFKRKEKEDFILSLPMQVSNFLELFDELNDKLEDNLCNHTLKHTEHFLNKQKLPSHNIIPWLNAHGGYCDCEVLFNVEEKFEELL